MPLPGKMLGALTMAQAWAAGGPDAPRLPQGRLAWEPSVLHWSGREASGGASQARLIPSVFPEQRVCPLSFLTPELADHAAHRAPGLAWNCMWLLEAVGPQAEFFFPHPKHLRWHQQPSCRGQGPSEWSPVQEAPAWGAVGALSCHQKALQPGAAL